MKITFSNLTIRVIGELFLCSFIWGAILFCFITVFCFLSFWKDFFCEYLQKKKEEKLMYLSISQFFMLEGYELTEQETNALTLKATQQSEEKNIFIKEVGDKKYFHQKILKTIFNELYCQK